MGNFYTNGFLFINAAGIHLFLRFFSPMTIAFLMGALGAVLAEVVKRWEQFGKITDEKFAALHKSPKVWAAVALLTVLGGLGGIFAFQEADKASLQFLFVSGAGMMLFVRNVLAAVAHNQPEKLGTQSGIGTKTKITFKDLFN
jgi:hypothetical protein